MLALFVMGPVAQAKKVQGKVGKWWWAVGGPDAQAKTNAEKGR